MNIVAWLERAAHAEPQRPAIALGDQVVRTHGELAGRTSSIAGALAGAGLRPGARIAIVARNEPAYIEAMLAIWWAGLVAVPVNAKLHISEIEWLLAHCEAEAAFVGAELEQSVAGLELPTLRLLLGLGGHAYEQMTTGERSTLAQRRPDDVAWLFYTSGTTGRSKGAMLTHRNLLAMSLSHLAEVDPTGLGEPFLHAAPLSHGSGLLMVPHLCRAGLNVVPESGGFEAEEMIVLAERWRSASTFLAPTMVRRLLDTPAEIEPGTFRTIVWGGAPMHLADTERALERLGPCLAQIYGQGETPMTITYLAKEELSRRRADSWEARAASAGLPRSPVEVMIVGEEDRPLCCGEPGEVLVRGETVMSGYWADPAASAEALCGGWLHTGDIGAIDGEGYLTLLDRSKDLIISGGSNIYPREVEEVLAAHPDVREISVIGRPDPEWGEVVVACVVGDVSVAELDRLCLDRIARFKRPKDYVFLDELPKSNYGKVLKGELRERDAASPSGEVGERG